MNEELRGNLEMQEVPEVREYAQSVIEIGAQEQEAVLEQAEDGSWRHADNSPFSPFYVPDRKQKKNNRLTIGLVVLLLLLLIAGLIFAVSNLVEAAVGEATVAWNESAGAVEDFFAGIKEEFKEESAQEEPVIEEHDWSDNPLPDDEEYMPSSDDEYYVELANAIRDDLSYTVDMEDYSYSDLDKRVYIDVSYAKVSDDIPNSSKINEYLETGAMYYAILFEKEAAEGLNLLVESYVTYMDEEVLSVVVDERYMYNGDERYNLYCMNFDLITGTLLYNTDIVEVTGELVQAFRDQSEYQNGYSSMVEDYTDEEIMDLLSDEEALILYYTPVGLELGYNHPYGWITATFKDYQEYLKKI